MRNAFTVIADWDDEAEVWFVHYTDIPGLAVEEADLDTFEETVRAIADELIQANVPDAGLHPVILISSLA